MTINFECVYDHSRILVDYLQEMRTFFACLSWSAASVIMNVVNKEVAVRYKSHNEVVCAQMLVTALVQLPFLKLLPGWYTWACVVPWLFLGMLVTSMYALESVSIGSFVVARNAAPIVSYTLEVALSLEKFTIPRASMLIGLITGSVMYEWGSLSSSALGLFLVSTNILLGGCERFAQKELVSRQEMKCSKSTLSVINNGVAFVAFVPLLMLIEPRKVRAVLSWKNRSHYDIMILCASCFVATMLSWTGLWAQQQISATEFLVLGCVTKIVVVIIGIIAFEDSCTSLSITGAILSFSSGICFGLRYNIESRFESYFRPRKGEIIIAESYMPFMRERF